VADRWRLEAHKWGLLIVDTKSKFPAAYDVGGPLERAQGLGQLAVAEPPQQVLRLVAADAERLRSGEFPRAGNPGNEERNRM